MINDVEQTDLQNPEKDETMIFGKEVKFHDEKFDNDAEDFEFRRRGTDQTLMTVDAHNDDPDDNNEFEWDELDEIILRGEFSDFEEYKTVRKSGRAYVMLVHYSRLLIHSMFFIAVMYAAITWALFACNFRLLVADSKADVPFDVITFVVLFLFVVDFAVSNIGALDYIISFYFWTDIISIVVLIFDLTIVRNRIFAVDTSVNKWASHQFYFVVDVIRIVRLMKVIRNFFIRKYTWRFEYYKKFFGIPERRAKVLSGDLESEEEADKDENQGYRSIRKSAPLAPKGSLSKNPMTLAYRKQTTQTVNRKASMVVGGFKPKSLISNFVFKSRKFKESRIARRILYLTNKRVMMLFLFVLILLPMFSVQFWTTKTLAYEKDLVFIEAMHKADPTLTANYIENDFLKMYEDYHSAVLFVELGTAYQKTFDDGTYLREEEALTWSSSDGSSSAYVPKQIRISIRSFVQIQALLNIFRVIFVFCLLFLRIYYFHKEAREKILDPLERLLEKIRLMAKDPSRALAMGKGYQEMKNTDLMIIEDTIQKISYLLVLGFGEAGNSILSKILYSKEMEIDFLSKPNTVYGIFGFCDIRNFTDATETLVEDVLEFVNKIAKIVHGEVSSNEGGANKNIGDAFLVVWKLKNKGESDVHELTKPSLSKEEKQRIENRYSLFRNSFNVFDNNSFQNFRGTLENHNESANLLEKFYNNASNSSMAELSLISFLKIMARLLIDKDVQQYNKNTKLLRAVPGFKVNMGFGLHAGWAIEGAIGSNLKIDMSYLSPNVNMSSRLEGLTKVYGVPLLFTSSLFNLFNTPKIKDLCRMVDRFYISGTTDTYELYTIDVFPKELEIEAEAVVTRSFTFDLISSKNIRIDNMTKSYISMEKKLEKDSVVQETNDEIREEDYIDYSQIERMWEYIIMDENLIKLLKLRRTVKEDKKLQKIIRLYITGMEEYIEGHWKNAKELFEKVLKRNDKQFGSLKALLDFMKQSDFEPRNDFLHAREHS